MSKSCFHCGAFGGTVTNHRPNCIVQVVADQAARDRDLKFVAVHHLVMYGSESVARAKSKTMAKRIANALNVYQPNRRGE